MTTRDGLKEAIVDAAIAFRQSNLGNGCEAYGNLMRATRALIIHDAFAKPCSDWSCPKAHRIEPIPGVGNWQRYHLPEPGA